MSAAQGTEGWLIERLGHVTGSRFHDVSKRGRDGKYLKARETAITEITLELLTGQPGAMWTSKATNWGKAYEATARMAYEATTREFVTEVGFIAHPHHMQVGASPDGLIGKRKGYESKCPLTPTVHLDTLLNGMPDEHIAQVQGGMWICDCDEWDFVSFHPQFPEGMQLYIQTIKRDNAYIEVLKNEVLSAVNEINSNVTRLLAKYGAARGQVPPAAAAVPAIVPAAPAAPDWRTKFLPQ